MTLAEKFVNNGDKDNVGVKGGVETFTLTTIVSASVPSVNIKVAVPLELKTTGIGPWELEVEILAPVKVQAIVVNELILV
jgi:hypothetical protein